jgi:NitT/TauT family transport system ATP-binding protein
MHLISALDRDYSGQITVAGAEPGTGPALGYMFQSPRLMNWLTVLDNVRLVATPEAIAAGRPERLLNEMRLGEFLHNFPNQLSGGMQRRVALARAFVNQPPLLLLDEPFISLDEPVADMLRGLLLKLWQDSRASVLFVTHDLREALALGDRVLFMSASPGRVVLDLPIGLPRPRDPRGPDLEALRQRLMAEHPSLLAGLATEEAPERAPART